MDGQRRPARGGRSVACAAAHVLPAGGHPALLHRFRSAGAGRRRGALSARLSRDGADRAAACRTADPRMTLFVGGLLGGVLGLGAWMVATAVVDARRTPLVVRVLPYVRDLPHPSSLPALVPS